MARRGRSSTRGIEWQRVRQWLLDQRDRVIIFSLIGLITVLGVFILTVTVRETVEERLTDRLPPEESRAPERRVDLERIVESYRTANLEEGYDDIISQSMFEPAAARRERIGRIREQYESGRRLFEEGRLQRAEEAMQTILRLDPFEGAIDYPDKPSNILKRIQNQIDIRWVADQHERLQTIIEQGREQETQGNLEQARLRYRDALRIYDGIRERDPEKSMLDKPVYEQIERDMTQVDSSYSRITRQRLVEVFRETASRCRTLLVDAQTAEQVTTKVDYLSQARDAIGGVRQQLADDDPEQEFVPAADRTQLDTLETEVSEAVDALLPAIREELERSVPQVSIETPDQEVSEVQSLLEALTRLEPDSPNVKAWRKTLSDIVVQKQRIQVLEEISQTSTEVAALDERIREYRRSRDYEAWDAAKLRAAELRRKMEDYAGTEDPEVRSQAENVTRAIAALPDPPAPITGWHYVQLDTSGVRPVVRLCRDGSDKVFQFFVGFRGPDNLTVTRLAEDGNWVIISQGARDKRDTRLNLEKDYECGRG